MSDIEQVSFLFFIVYSFYFLVALVCGNNKHRDTAKRGYVIGIQFDRLTLSESASL